MRIRSILFIKWSLHFSRRLFLYIRTGCKNKLHLILFSYHIEVEKILSQEEASAGILIFRSARKTQTW